MIGLEVANQKTVPCQDIKNGKQHRHALVESFNGSLREELLNAKIFDSIDHARRKRSLWSYDYTAARQHC